MQKVVAPIVSRVAPQVPLVIRVALVDIACLLVRLVHMVNHWCRSSIVWTNTHLRTLGAKNKGRISFTWFSSALTSKRKVMGFRGIPWASLKYSLVKMGLSFKIATASSTSGKKAGTGSSLHVGMPGKGENISVRRRRPSVSRFAAPLVLGMVNSDRFDLQELVIQCSAVTRDLPSNEHRISRNQREINAIRSVRIEKAARLWKTYPPNSTTIVNPKNLSTQGTCKRPEDTSSALQ